jgi:hypothetical protein
MIENRRPKPAPTANGSTRVKILAVTNGSSPIRWQMSHLRNGVVHPLRQLEA